MVTIRHLAARACLTVSLATWAAAQTPGAPPAPAGAPAAPAVPAPDPTLPDLLKELKTMVADPKMEEDFRAIGLVQKLAADPEKRNPKDKEKIAKAFGDVFHNGKVRPMDKSHLYKEVATSLGKFGEDGAKELVHAAQDPRFKDKEFVPLRAMLIVETGRTKDDKQIDWLLEQALRSPIDEIMAAGGEALGFFTEMEGKKRHEVVKDLLRRYGELHAKATQPEPRDPSAPVDFSPQNARATLNKVEGKWTSTLATLTGQSFTTYPDWQHWLNKNPNWVVRAAPKKK